MLCEKQPAPGVGDAVAGCGRRWTGRSASGDASRSAEGTFGDRLGDSVGAGFCRDGSCEGGLLFSLPLLTLFSGLVYFVNAKWARISERKTLVGMKHNYSLSFLWLVANCATAFSLPA